MDDEEWNAVAQRIVHATGIAPAGDLDGFGWIAVRHAEDLRNPRLNYDFNKAQAECRRLEKEMGLRRLNAGDGTPSSWHTRVTLRVARRLPPAMPRRRAGAPVNGTATATAPLGTIQDPNRRSPRR
ncbi:hypothetical protein ACIRFF_16855 [Streptomyces cyaneofuscatus]